MHKQSVDSKAWVDIIQYFILHLALPAIIVHMEAVHMKEKLNF